MSTRTRRATVAAIVQDCGDTLFIEVECDGRRERAVNYTQLSGTVRVGDEVVINTTAQELKLGSGGQHFIVANLTCAELPRSEGHIMKLRYTPLQTNVLAVEEEASPHHPELRDATSLDGMPVVVAMVHSMIAPIAAGIRAAAGRETRVVYVMTDSAALAMGFSHLVRSLKSAGLIHATVSCGQSFGGDFEAVNLYSALTAARVALDAEAVIVAPGVGHVGTGTALGFSGIEQAAILDGVKALDGRAIAALRISFADPRERHRGVSHHSQLALGRLTHARAMVPIPDLTEEEMQRVREQLRESGIASRHEILAGSGRPALYELARHDIRVTTMGRTIDEDLAYFLAAGAAGEYAGELLRR